MNVADWLTKAEKYLRERGVDETSANAEFLMAQALKAGRGEVRLGGARPLTDKQSFYFWEMIKARGRRLPMAYVIGNQPFLSLEIDVTPDVLVPRPETEEVVMEAERLLSELKRPELHILEIGTGSGCIAIAISKLFPQAVIFASEISSQAIKLAEKNAMKHHVSSRIRFIREDLFKPSVRHAGWADLVISNPPYIPSAEVKKLAPEVLNEPYLALDGGPDGLAAIRAIIEDAPRHLKKGSSLVLEIGSDQGAEVSRLMSHRGFSGAYVRRDAQGHDRIAVGRW